MRASQGALVVKKLRANAGDIKDMGSIPGSGRSPAIGNGNPLQNSCLDNPVDSGAWPVTVYEVAKGQMRLSTHTTKISYPSYHVKATRVYLIYHCWCWLWSAGWSGVSLFPTFPYCTLWKEYTIHREHVQSSLNSVSWELPSLSPG